MMTDRSVVSFDCDSVEFELHQDDSVREWLLGIAAMGKVEIGQLEYVFCSDERLLEINKTYLQHDYYTDIITFPLQEDPLEATIFISIERVQENCRLYQSSFDDELHRVIAHGLLHLIGHTDKTDAEKSEMRKKEEECLAQRAFV